MGETAGQMFALGAALSWAIGSLLFSRVRVAAAAINLFKNSLSAVLLLLVLIGLAWFGDSAVFCFDPLVWGSLAASSAVGLVIGDTFHFRSLQIIGPRRCVVLETLAPPLSALFGWWFLAESLGAMAALGMVITLAGIVVVVLERSPSQEGAGHFPGSALLGVLCGLLAALCQALGAALSKVGLQRLAEQEFAAEVTAVSATWVRLVVAVVLGLALAICGGRLATWIGQIRVAGTLRVLIPASCIGTLLGVTCSMLSFQYTSIAVASTLAATSPIFIIPLVILVLKQRVSLLGFLGALLAVLGVAILFAT